MEAGSPGKTARTSRKVGDGTRPRGRAGEIPSHPPAFRWHRSLDRRRRAFTRNRRSARTHRCAHASHRTKPECTRTAISSCRGDHTEEICLTGAISACDPTESLADRRFRRTGSGCRIFRPIAFHERLSPDSRVVARRVFSEKRRNKVKRRIFPIHGNMVVLELGMIEFVRLTRWHGVLLGIAVLCSLPSLTATSPANPAISPINSPTPMKPFVLIFRQNPQKPRSAADSTKLAAEMRPWAQRQNEEGRKLTPHILEPESRNFGTDSPATALQGVWPVSALLFINARDLNEAAEIAQSHPGLHYGAVVEVRAWTVPVPPSPTPLPAVAKP